jgi:uncharacterized protein YndB with AHSA1/START domain
MNSKLEPKLDLTFTRIVDVPKELVWRCWTEPKLLLPWFCPKPWQTIACEIDLRPGGLFSSIMQSPEGQTYPNMGCYLEVLPNARLTWTSALQANFRPTDTLASCGADEPQFSFTASISFEDHKTASDIMGTKYTATVLHANEAGCKQHADMGFEGGWGTALDQMVAMIKKGI